MLRWKGQWQIFFLVLPVKDVKNSKYQRNKMSQVERDNGVTYECYLLAKVRGELAFDV